MAPSDARLRGASSLCSQMLGRIVNLSRVAPLARSFCVGQVVVSANSVEWQSQGDDMRIRTLFTDPLTGRYAVELEMDPNANYPDHLHTSEEFCFIASGSIHDHNGWKFKDDFFFNEIGSKHTDIFAGNEGCRILVVKGEGVNEWLTQR